MNAKLTLFNSLLIASVVSGCNYADASGPIAVEQQEQISIVSRSYHVVKIDSRCSDFCPATLATEDEEYEIKVEFKYSTFDDGNGMGYSAVGAEIEEMEIIAVEDQLGEEVNAYIDQFEIERINDALVEGILKERRA